MKKLMIAAALAAIAGGAFADDCGKTAQPCGFGYRLRVIVRTTAAEKITNADPSCCDCFRKPAVRRILGFVYGTTSTNTTPAVCGKSSTTCGCNDWSAAKIALWDYDTKAAINTDSAELLQLNRIGYENRTRAEMCFKVAMKCDNGQGSVKGPYDLTFAGFGTCGKRDGVITLKTVSGFCAGLLPSACGSTSECAKDGVCGSAIWAMCDDAVQISECGSTAAYGKWNLTWNQDIANFGQSKTDSLKGAEVDFGDGRLCK